MTDFLLLASLFLVAGVIAVPIASLLGLGSVLGYLIAGIAIGPVLALIGVDVVEIQHFAEFGVVMMLFLVGLELEPKRLWEMRNRLIGLGGLQVGLTALAVGAVALFLGQPWSVSLAIGLVFSLSSTAIVLQTLGEKGLMKSDGGQSSFSVLLFQDIAVIPMLALIPLLAMPELIEAMSHHGADDSGHAAGAGFSLVAGLEGWQVALVNIGAIAAVILGGSFLTRPIFQFVSRARLRELFTATALMIVIVIALLMTLVGLSPALGTFLAGVVLANSEYRHELESDIDPFRGLLLGLFFMTVGAGVDFGLLAANLWAIVGMTLGLMLLKAAILLLLAYIFNVKGADKWLFALGLAQAGEFGFVLLSFTVASAVIPAEIASQLLLVVALSMLLTPLLFILFDRVIAPRYSLAEEREADEIDNKSPIIIAGAGRVGGLVYRIMRGAGYNPTAIDYSSEQLDILRRFGFQHFFGDATRPDLLHAAGIAEAKLLIIAIDDREQITELVRYVVKHYPHVHIIARAVTRDHVYELWGAGCRDIIRDTYDGSLRVGRSAFEALGIPHDKAVRMVEAFNEMDRRAMIEVAEVFNPEIRSSLNEPYVAKVKEIMTTWEPELFEKMESIRKEGARPKSAARTAQVSKKPEAKTARKRPSRKPASKAP